MYKVVFHENNEYEVYREDKIIVKGKDQLVCQNKVAKFARFNDMTKALSGKVTLGTYRKISSVWDRQ